MKDINIICKLKRRDVKNEKNYNGNNKSKQDKKNKKIIEYYFDIILESGIDENIKIPYFIDAYLDITISSTGEIAIIDIDELDEALERNDMSKEEYDSVLKTSEELLKEIKNNTNELLKIDYWKYLKDM